jgi:formylmethanofuran dehydrogenase subunit E
MFDPLRYAPIFRQIYNENIIPIQEAISVEWDNRLQTPISFEYLGNQYEVVELIGIYPDSSSSSLLSILVRTPQGIFVIYLDPGIPAHDKHNLYPIQQGVHWVLHYAIQEKSPTSEVDMLVDLKLKRIADFHGHLCPELVIGYRAAQYALSRFEVNLALPNLRVIMMNSTSAIDAIQMLTGCTLGNRRLSIRDEGKQVYIFQVNEQEGLCISLSDQFQEVSPEFLILEQKIQTGTASLEDIASYQYILDQRIIELLHSPIETLFDIKWVKSIWRDESISYTV